MIITCDILHRDEVFNDGEGNMLMKGSLQTLAPRMEVETSVIDTYVSILNYEESFKENNLRRQFFYTGMTVRY